MEIQTLLDDGNEHIDRDRDPYLGFDRVLRSAEERLDSKMLFDPLEEQFDLPALTIQLADRARGKRGIVGEKDQGLALGVLEADAPQRPGIAVMRVIAGKHQGLIADQTCAAVDGMRIKPLRLVLARMTKKLPA